MNKSLLKLICLICCICFINVKAASFSTSINGNTDFSDNINLNLQVNNLDGFTGVCNGLCGLTGTLSYDTSKIQLASINSLNGFDLTQGKQIVLYKTTGVSSGSNVFTMIFKNIGLSNGESTTIKFTGVTGSDGDNDISGTGSSKTIKLVLPQNNTNTVSEEPQVTTPSSNTETKSNKVSTSGAQNSKNTTDNSTNNPSETNEIVEAPKSNNAYLSELTFNYGQIDFSKDTSEFNLDVNNKLNSIIINGKAEDSKATIVGLGTFDLPNEKNDFTIKVTAEDGTTKEYVVHINKINDSNLTCDTVNTTNNRFSIIILVVYFVAGILATLLVKNRKKIVNKLDNIFRK